MTSQLGKSWCFQLYSVFYLLFSFCAFILYSGIVTHILSFVSEKFHPCLARTFVMQSVYDHYLCRMAFRTAVEKSLCGNDLGSHADINLFTAHECTTFIWSSQTSRPFGQRPPSVCPTCGVPLWTMKSPASNQDPSNVSLLRCRFCKAESDSSQLTFRKPDDLLDLHDFSGMKYYSRKLLIENWCLISV